MTLEFHDERYVYTGYNDRPAECRLRIFRSGPKSHDSTRWVIIASELHDNPGTSITNMAGPLSATVAKQFGINPSRMTWIEHHHDRHPERDKSPDRYSIVTFKEFAGPRWTRVEASEVEKMVKRHLD